MHNILFEYFIRNWMKKYFKAMLRTQEGPFDSLETQLWRVEILQ